jgi:drug/metabolite transporter (DMT)-like permease
MHCQCAAPDDVKTEAHTTALESVGPTPHQKGRIPGPWTMLVGYVLLGLQPVPVKALGQSGWSAPWVVVARFAFGVVAIALVCLVRGRGLSTKQPGVLFLRGLLGGIAVVLYFTSIQLAGVGPGTVLNYSYPLWANVFAVLFLGHRVPRSFWLLLAIALGGVWLIVDPLSHVKGGATEHFGELSGVVSAIAAGAAVLCIKRLRETDESLTIVASFSVLGFLISLPLALLPSGLLPTHGEPSFGTSEWALAFATGALAFGGHIYFTRGYRGTSVQLGTALSLTVPAIAAVAGALVLGEPLGARFVIGGALVLGACFGIGRLDAPPKPL